MNRFFIFSVAAGLSAFLLTVLPLESMQTGGIREQAAAPIDSIRALKNYVTYCAGCHGGKMDAFVDRTWKHGSSREDLFRGIKHGYDDEGMPGFDSAFNDEEIYELSDYMLKSIARFRTFLTKEEKNTVNYFDSKYQAVRLDTVFTGIKSIWGMSFLPDGSMLATEKYGKLFHIGKDNKATEITGLPHVLAEGQGGLMDVLVHPAFSKNKYVYLTYSASKKEGNTVLATTAILRAKLVNNKLTEASVIFEAFPYVRAKHHYGSRMVFGKDGMLYFSVGERGNEKEFPQSLSNDLGKIHRIKDDGTVPADNPFVNTKDARKSIWSYGHRNPQGLVVHPQTGDIWSNEHGPRGGDEVNIIRKGANYGWPAITYGINYNGKIISTESERPGMEQPVRYWIPSIGPSGMAFVTGNRYGQWKGNLLSGSLRFGYVNLSMINKKTITEEEMLLRNVGRVRDVRMGPDGYIYVAVENPGAIYRLVPVGKRAG